MIVFDLRCMAGHVFEGWFTSSAAYEEQAQSGGVACPECGDTHISKAITAPRVNCGARQPQPAVGPCGMPCAANGCQIGE